MKIKQKKKKRKKQKKNQNTANSKKFLDEINYVKPPENYKSFIQNYMNVVRSKINHDDYKSLLEKFDKDGLGTLSKLIYVKAIATLLPEFKDEDHMRFLRITNMFDKAGDVKYPDMLNLIFFYQFFGPFHYQHNFYFCQLLSNLKHFLV